MGGSGFWVLSGGGQGIGHAMGGMAFGGVSGFRASPAPPPPAPRPSPSVVFPQEG